MATEQKNAEPVRTQLQELAAKIATTIYHQKMLIDLAKQSTGEEEAETEALLISIDRFNDDLFKLFEELEKIADAAAKEPAQ